jgi:hypothetical protein
LRRNSRDKALPGLVTPAPIAVRTPTDRPSSHCQSQPTALVGEPAQPALAPPGPKGPDRAEPRAQLPQRPAQPIPASATRAMGMEGGRLVWSAVMRRHKLVSRAARRRAAIGALLALPLALVVAIPTLAATSPKKKVKSPIPSCSHLSTTAMATVLGSARLSLKEKKANLCIWEALRPGHYHETLAIDIIPGIKSIYKLAEADGMKNAAKEGKQFGTLSSRHSPWKAAFFVTKSIYNDGLEPCPPEHTTAPFGPPQCSGDPSWTTIDVDSYNSKLMLSVGVAAQVGDVYLSHVIALNREILAGKIH